MAKLDDPDRLDSIGAHVTATVGDEILDQHVRDAARRAEAPIALVTIVMDHIQYFKSAVGLPSDLERSRATSRSSSFCQFVVREEGPFLVTEASSDARVPQDLVGRYGIQAYAGVPIRSDGQVVGSLCVIDTKPHAFKPGVVDALTSIASKVGQRLDTLKMLHESHEPEAMRTTALVLWLSGVLTRSQSAKASIAKLDARLGRIMAADVAMITAELAGGAAGSPTGVAALYREVEEHVRVLRDGALRVADAIELRGPLDEKEVLTLLRVGARALHRSMRELAPFMRLIQGLGDGSITAEELKRNVEVLGEALGACRTMDDTLKRFQETGARLMEGLRKGLKGGSAV